MVYITDEDIEDEALRDVMQTTDYEYASRELEAFATRLSVATIDIAIPLNLTVREYVLAIAYARRAELNIGLGNRVMDGKDVYAYKQYIYRNKIKDLEARITPSMLTGISSSGAWSPSIPLYRG